MLPLKQNLAWEYTLPLEQIMHGGAEQLSSSAAEEQAGLTPKPHIANLGVFNEGVCDWSQSIGV